jgi:RNA polymerase sigma-70 factor (ECF subfamily)
MEGKIAAVMPDDPSETFSQHRSLLFSIAYRMLGSATDAEDILQDAFLRWRARPSGDVESPRRFLVTIVSRLCINHLKSARVAREQYVGPWLPEPLPTDTGDEPSDALLAGETISMAFMLVLERLNPIERAVFILREVFGYDYSEIAAIVTRSEESCRQLLHRAHGHLKREGTRFEPSPEQHEDLLQRFLAAALHGDMDGLVSVLSRDVVLYADGGGKAAAVPNPIHGADRVVRLLAGALRKFAPSGFVTRAMQINGQLGIVAYDGGEARTVVLVDSHAGAIRNIFLVANPDKLSHIPTFDTLEPSQNA